jgi:hypothetical protein
VSSYTATIRHGPKVERERFDELRAALDAIEARGRELEAGAHADPTGGKLFRRMEPQQLVVARIELSGKGVRAGVDVRGDGSSEPWTGRLRRKLIVLNRGESAYEALRRSLTPGA